MLIFEQDIGKDLKYKHISRSTHWLLQCFMCRENIKFHAVKYWKHDAPFNLVKVANSVGWIVRPDFVYKKNKVFCCQECADKSLQPDGSYEMGEGITYHSFKDDI